MPWSVILVSYFLCVPVGYSLWFIMRRENRRRDELAAKGVKAASSKEHNVSVRLGAGASGEDEKSATAAATPDEAAQAVKLDAALLDLTDRQNLHFRYPL